MHQLAVVPATSSDQFCLAGVQKQTAVGRGEPLSSDPAQNNDLVTFKPQTRVKEIQIIHRNVE